MSAVATKATKTTKKPAVPTKALAPLITMPALAKGEHWAGIMITDGRPTHHLVLLPGEQRDIDWKKSGAWAAKQHAAGRLPTRPEQALLFANLKDQFRERAYWSDTQSADFSDWAWFQNFGDGGQYYYYESAELACRAVRSIPI